jgi:hypothetical protein
MIGLSLSLYREVGYYDNTSNKLYVNCDKDNHTCDVIEDVNEDILCQYDVVELIAIVNESQTRLYFKDSSQIILYKNCHFYYA